MGYARADDAWRRVFGKGDNTIGKGVRSGTGEWPDLSRERTHGGIVCGVDEVGVAPLAGPVVAAAVVLPVSVRKPRKLRGLTDSKQLTRKERERFDAIIRDIAQVAIGLASVDEIDEINIYHANHLAMQRAVADLAVEPDVVLVDGRAAPRFPCPVEAIVKGDRLCLSIAAASVVAKVARDKMMRDLACQHPGYGWETNVGYATDEHYLGLLRLGPTPHHRRSFAPISTHFAAEGLRQLELRFEPSSGARGFDHLRLVELRQDLIAVFDNEACHVAVLKRLRGTWRVRAIGYDLDGNACDGAGPLAPLHNRSLDSPDSTSLTELISRLP